MKALLVLGKGDTPYSDRNRSRLVDYARRSGFEVQQADYHQIRTLPGFGNEKINVMFFFPYAFWNSCCEVPKDTQLYGTSRVSYDKFKRHFLQAKEQLERRFGGQTLQYAISPENAPVDRDKVETIKRLRAGGVPTSDPLAYASLTDIKRALTPQRGIFIKCRYGSEGKGITVLHHDRWVTNYKVEGNRLTNYGVYDAWAFSDITGREDLLGQLLRHDVIVEREIRTPPVFKNQKFDVRAYVVGQTVPHLFARVNSSDKEVTNYSQGAQVRHHPDTGLGGECLDLARQIALKAARALGLRFVGVDIMFDGHLGNAKVVEAQAFTDFPDIGKFNMAQYLVGAESGLFS